MKILDPLKRFPQFKYLKIFGPAVPIFCNIWTPEQVFKKWAKTFEPTLKYVDSPHLCLHSGLSRPNSHIWYALISFSSSATIHAWEFDSHYKSTVPLMHEVPSAQHTACGTIDHMVVARYSKDNRTITYIISGS